MRIFTDMCIGGAFVTGVLMVFHRPIQSVSSGIILVAFSVGAIIEKAMAEK